ncbi:MAG: 16S rRNA (cytidine(1402)-2'-O)-methyltransferase [Corynebacterium sp.]|jgi:16S rRNA (cytidine1402-2'-O)-methyltransferase|uniref:16S rRNA (cytidine(1402)-2'-O)-methyltransferase n=1 Tax=unclassified Corynebacterium TaxID=2624378 RepID=UPI0009657CF1|nr:16S rRNA (cytidine(1402)-2'-O)-methyltransferase [Corynebacterium sp. CNJ-954]OLT55394.1 16S rRNA (cytidine(1402)-2'-O)-methyltransferase [Corynebacterium sp. CNJ-954]
MQDNTPERPESDTVTRALERARADRPLPGGGVILAATPLGDPLDASIRLIDALGSADVVAAEDTRRTRALADALGVEITGKIVSNFDHNESDRAAGLVARAAAGARVLVVTDAGMPAVSDPGFPLVQAAQHAGVPVTCLPGPSAVPTALALSGVGVGHFAFDGFAPRKDGARRQWLESVRDSTRAVSFFESPHRLAATLSTAAEVCGADREAAVCRELTKKFEEVVRGPLGELATWAANGVRGEITVVISASSGPEVRSPEELVGEVEEKVEQGLRLKDATREVSAVHGVSRRELYEAVLAARQG